jgi:hypothetical protein
MLQGYFERARRKRRGKAKNELLRVRVRTARTAGGMLSRAAGKHARMCMAPGFAVKPMPPATHRARSDLRYCWMSA